MKHAALICLSGALTALLSAGPSVLIASAYADDAPKPASQTPSNPPPAAKPAANATQIPFARGKGHAIVGGVVGKGDNPTFYFTGHAGQSLTYVLHQPKNAGLVLTWAITFPSGKSYGTKGLDPFDGHLTENGRYTIVVGRNNMASNAMVGSFHMTLSLTNARHK